MLPSMLRTLQDTMGLGELIEGQRHALLPEHVEQYVLPQSLEAIKASDTRTPKFKAMLRDNGYEDTLAVELDALPAPTLEIFVRVAIEQNLDLYKLTVERELERAERSSMEGLKAAVVDFVQET